MAAILLDLGLGDHVWPLLRSGLDPSLRASLIHEFGPSQVNPLVLIHQLEATTDDSVRQALILRLASTATIPCPRESGSRRLASCSSSPATTRTRASIPRSTGCSGAGRRARSWTGSRRKWRLTARAAAARWYVNRHHHTMAVVRGPVGLTVKEAEFSCPVRIPRSFAVGTKEVTNEQFDRFRGPAVPGKEDDARKNLPPVSMSWYDAARYCRWLSERENIPSEEMCYPPLDQIREGMKPIPDYLHRKGYRLPTEPEWEYACRAGVPGSRYFGNEEKSVRHYAWTVLSADGHPWPAGLLKPNDLGLFDSLGNVCEWCQGFPRRRCSPPVRRPKM